MLKDKAINPSLIDLYQNTMKSLDSSPQRSDLDLWSRASPIHSLTNTPIVSSQNQKNFQNNKVHFKDPEDMMNEIQRMKIELESVVQEKRMMSTKYKVLEQQYLKLQKSKADEKNAKNISFAGPQEDKKTTLLLKNALREKTQTIKTLYLELQNVKDCIKGAKMTEYDIKCEVYQAEILRLTRLLEHKEIGDQFTKKDGNSILEFDEIIEKLQNELNISHKEICELKGIERLVKLK
ncbi:hypothetical protein HK096_003291 [Nowakowskiella sp. JEL0078]|nr:hypothetical protein HK096_003291 [Nowakowskiella sp. JEL0078]